MPRGFAIELFFDPEGDAAVRRIWTDLAPQGGHVLAAAGARPHVTLGVFGVVDPAAFAPALARFAASAAPLDVSLASVGVFPGEARVVFLAPVVTAELLAVHRRFHEELGAAGQDPWPHYAPGRWVPHCTLAMELAAEALPRAVELARRAPLPIPVRLAAVGLVEFRPIVERAVFRLAG